LRSTISTGPVRATPVISTNVSAEGTAADGFDIAFGLLGDDSLASRHAHHFSVRAVTPNLAAHEQKIPEHASQAHGAADAP
jgi:hypothetical protein